MTLPDGVTTVEGLGSPVRLLLHAVVVAFVGLSGYIGKNALEPTIRGFFCQDASISYPFYPNTVNYCTVLLWSNLLLLAAIAYAELYYHGRRVEGASFRPFELVREGKSWRLSRTLTNCLQFGLIATLGFFINVWVTSAIKLSQGELRPHFLGVCKPVRNGTPITFPCATNEYIDTYSCVKPETDRLLRDARQSFPSGHTASAFYYATFLIIYLHARVAVHDKGRMTLFVIVYAVLLIAASFVGISRIFDNKHHPIDVAAGQLIGIFIAASMLYCSKHMFTNGSTKHAAEAGQNKEPGSEGGVKGRGPELGP